MNRKELFLSALKNTQPPQWMGNAYDPFAPGFPMVIDPVTLLDASFSGERYVDLWGATWRHMPTDPGAIPMANAENAVIKDIENWQSYVKFPSLDGLDWTGAHAQIAALDRENTFVMIPSFYGPFERAHALMPFDEVLINMQLEPELMYDLFGALTDWKIKAIGLVIDNLQPDIIHSHDDWGSRDNLFFSPELFRKLLKPHYTRLYDYIHSRGVLVQHHADCYCQGLENDLVEMGVDMWQGAIPQNDIVQIFKNTQGRLSIIGGIDQTLFDFPGFDEEVVRAEARRAIDDYAGKGPFLPGVCSVTCMQPGVDAILADELNRYGAQYVARFSV